jgi:hypothetical protein
MGCVTLRDVIIDRRRIDMTEINIHAHPGLQHVDHDKPDDERDRGQNLEISERFDGDATDSGHVRHARNSVHHRAKDNRRNHHANGFDESVSEALHLLAEIGREVAERDADHHGRNHLHPKLPIPGATAPG